MLTRISIDNYKCYSNFELTIDRLSLLLGPNGAGKSTLFEVLAKLQALVGGSRADTIFFASELTRWTTLNTQRFELEIAENGDQYRYEVGLRFGTEEIPTVILDYERLWFDKKPLLQFEDGTVQLYRDDHTIHAQYPLDPSQSAVTLVPYRKEFERINRFRRRIFQMIIVQLVPPAMEGDSERENPILELRSRNFVSWYRAVSKDQGFVAGLTQQLQEVLPGFSHFVWLAYGEHRQALIAKFIAESDRRVTYDYAFHQLSDGQRMLVGLYALLLFAGSTGHVLCIDEPDNFLALPEIQPWLINLFDRTTDGAFQALVITHHPETINYLAASQGIWFERRPNGSIGAKPILPESTEGGLSVAELITRGWLHV